jgi:diguanylate cyclase (GGDEF)-like protein
VLIDLTGFGHVNALIGHDAGDGILREVAGRLTLACGDHLVARTGDDEFAVLALGVAEDQAAGFARRMHAAAEFEFSGVAVRNAADDARFPRDADRLEDLVLAASTSLADAKKLESDRVVGPGDHI